jgi:uncharacterized repeat protein (TIGR01451 family)
MKIQKTMLRFMFSLIFFFAFFGKSYGQNLTYTISNATCCGLSNGAITVNLNSQINCGPGPYQYQIVGINPVTAPITSAVTSSTTFTWSNLMAGTYTINVLPGGGATVPCESGSVSITEPSCLIGTLTSTNDVSCSGGNDGSLTVTANGGVPPYSISIFGPTQGSGTGVPGGFSVFTNLQAGGYQAVVIDGNGCSFALSAFISSSPPLSVNVVGTAASSPTALDGSATVNFSGGTAPYTINWWNIGASTPTINSLGVGVYYACITDANGCEVCDSFAVIDTTIYTICVAGQVFCDQDNNGIFTNGDIALINAAVSVNHLGGLLTVYTDNLGYYNASFFGLPGNTSFVSINSNWLSNQGFATNTASFAITNVSCQGGGQPTNVPLPIICGPNQVVFYECYSGYLFCDANLDGQMNTGELPLVNFPVTLSNNSFTATVFTNSLGYFSYCGQLNSLVFDPTYATVNQQWLLANGYTTNNPTALISGSGSVGSTTPCMIPINCTPNACIDLWSICYPAGGGVNYFQGSPAYICLFWGNNGPSPSESYSLSLTYPAGVTVNTSTIDNINYTISGNTITWNFPASPILTSSLDNIMFYVPSGIPNGTPHYFTSSITATGTILDCNNQNDSSLLLQNVGQSYDPNDKVVSRNAMYQNLQNNTEEIDVNIQDVLTYTVRFQNTGTAPAQNIYILDTLDSNLDWSTFIPMQSSHPMIIVDQGNGVKRFEFNQIWLPDSSSNEPASHGALTYRIQENANNVVGSTIENTAHIFFDWNAPIITNTTYNINTTFLGVDETAENQLKLFPNPSAEFLNIHISPNIENSWYVVLDCLGRTVGSGILESKETIISVKHLANGLYHFQTEKQRVQFVVAH